jgi:hypothetical protein
VRTTGLAAHYVVPWVIAAIPAAAALLASGGQGYCGHSGPQSSARRRLTAVKRAAARSPWRTTFTPQPGHRPDD